MTTMTDEKLREGALKLRGVSLGFAVNRERLETMSGFDLDLEAGEFVSLLGPSGCGKSTLLRIIAGLQSVDGGTVLLDGVSIRKPGNDRAMVFQHHTLLPWKTVFENVEFGLKLRGESKSARRDEVKVMLSAVGLEGFANHYPAELSGGMQQRVNLARALVNRPKVLLLDEPFAALDALTRQCMQELLLDLWERFRMTVLFVTHDVDEAIFLADRVVVLSCRPARVRESFTVPLARPRRGEDVTEPAFIDIKRQCLEHLRADAGTTARRPGYLSTPVFPSPSLNKS